MTYPPTVTDLFIDMISLTWDCGSRHAEGISDILRHMQDDDNSYIRYNRFKPKTPGYKHNWNMTIPGVEHKPVLLSACPYRNGISGFRMQWNPRHYRGRTARQLWRQTQEVLLINFEDFLNQAEVTRIDLAVDICPLKPYSILVNVPRLKKHKSIYGYRGELQYAQFGVRGSPFSLCIYDKDPETGDLCSRISNTTRFEARVTDAGALCELATLENRFCRLEVYGSIDPIRFCDHSSIHQRISYGLAREIGLQPVMQMLGRTGNRRRFRVWLERELATDWFDPDDIWSGYPTALALMQIPPDAGSVTLPNTAPTGRRRRRRAAG